MGNLRTCWSIVANSICEAEGLRGPQSRKFEELGLWNAGRGSLVKVLLRGPGVEGFKPRRQAVKGEASTVQAAEKECYRVFTPTPKVTGEQVFTKPQSLTMDLSKPSRLSFMLGLKDTTRPCTLSDLTSSTTFFYLFCSSHISLSLSVLL